jgi:hypothetical protein
VVDRPGKGLRDEVDVFELNYPIHWGKNVALSFYYINFKVIINSKNDKYKINLNIV